MTPQFRAGQVRATPEAIELVEELKQIHGPVAFFHPGGPCEGAELVCLTRAELLPNPDDLRLGEVAGAPLYVDAHQYERWGRPEIAIDVAEGPASGLRLGGLDERHFVTGSVHGDLGETGSEPVHVDVARDPRHAARARLLPDRVAVPRPVAGRDARASSRRTRRSRAGTSPWRTRWYCPVAAQLVRRSCRSSACGRAAC